MQILSTGLVLTRELGKPIVLEQEGSKMTASIQGEKEVEVRGLPVLICQVSSVQEKRANPSDSD